MRLYKFDGAGNDFVVIDGRSGNEAQEYRNASRITELCDRKTGYKASDGRIGADGLMILSESDCADFRMEFFNPDGSGGMMCGNGGRCIVAFADMLAVAGQKDDYRFEAPDGMHEATILSRSSRGCVVRLGMVNPTGLRRVEKPDGWFLNTGTRHFVCFVEDVEAIDIEAEGPVIRHDAEFAPEGTNVNFVQITSPSSIKVRTFEKGVEAETLACGTGVTASAVVSYLSAKLPSEGPVLADGSVHIDVQARIAGLCVDFMPASTENNPVCAVYLTGPADKID